MSSLSINHFDLWLKTLVLKVGEHTRVHTHKQKQTSKSLSTPGVSAPVY